MKKRDTLHKFANLFVVITLATIIVLPTACEKNENDLTDPGQPPELPPESTFLIDFEEFANQDTNSKSLLIHHNWGRAATHVLVWNTLITATFIVPVAAFRESFNHTPVFDPDSDTWKWSYNFGAQGTVHLAELHGKVVNTGVEWKMYISKNNSYEKFLWFQGASNASKTEGEWHLNENPQNPEEIILIEWNRDNDAGETDIKYTNVKEGAPGNSGYIFYGINNDPLFNAFYHIYAPQEDNLAEIEWHRSNKNGRLKDPFHFDDNNWHCWDETLTDITCP